MSNTILRKIKGFGYAFRGLGLMLRDYNMQIHLPAAMAVLATGYYFGISPQEWLWLMLAIFTMLILETINTAIEKVVDLCSPELHPLAGQAKDIAAAAVLLGLFFAICVGTIVLGPYLLRAFGIS